MTESKGYHKKKPKQKDKDFVLISELIEQLKEEKNVVIIQSDNHAVESCHFEKFVREHNELIMATISLISMTATILTVCITVYGLKTSLSESQQSIQESTEKTQEAVQGIQDAISDTDIMPNVVGMEQQEATNLLLEIGFDKVTVFGEETGAEKYYIVEQSINAGQSISKGSSIELQRISVPLDKRVTVPDVVGMKQADAVKSLSEVGLRCKVWWTDETTLGGGFTDNVDGQSIPAGSLVNAGTTVDIQLGN